ncbi:uncharacterized protein PAC_13629 [Phialocephala subalpina]|uniref:Mid2 domain-containing protein n=1 Tax=Phialocephala subalpina TaxID=576137 RepID=A0A1L7XFC6_9HELO|nr:uncharacterized protein PAC_13629 [Phialocephala subalpina]
MTSYLDYTFFWGSQTPTGMAGISTNGPSNVPFACTPMYSEQYFTFTWYQLGNGCPVEYSWSPASTCISTAGVYNTMTWSCTWTTSQISTSQVNGGTITASAGQAATATAPVVWVTVTNTQQTTSTTTSVVDPGAKTVTVTSTQGVSKRDVDLTGALFPANQYGLDLLDSVEELNATYGALDPRADCVLGDINCGANCCLSDQTCIFGGTYPCCNGWACVPYNPKEPFTGNIYWSWTGATATSTSWVLQTTYSTVNPAGSTTTITPTSTTTANVVQTQTATATITTNDPTVTVVTVITPNTPITVNPFTTVITSGSSTITSIVTPIPATSTSTTTSSAAGSTSTGGSSNNKLIVGVAAGVGTPLGLCLIGLLIFLIFRHRHKHPKTPPPDIVGGSSAAVESGPGAGGAAYYVNAASMAHKPQAGPVIVEHQMSPDPNYHTGGGGQAGGYGYGPTSPMSQHSSEMFVPPNQHASVGSEGMYAQHPPRYASPPVYGQGPPGQGQYNEVAGGPVPDRYELHH